MDQRYSSYYDTGSVSRSVAAGEHRDLVGGRWEEIGLLQLDLLKKHGLSADHMLLDIGCGSLRGGVHFVRFLNRGNYFGTDLNASLIDAGFDVELKQLGLQDRLPRDQLITDSDFDLGFAYEGLFDRAIAFSLFTHLPLNSVRVCLEKLAGRMKEGGKFYATFFELPENIASHTDVQQQPGDIVTHGDADPYHYRIGDFAHAIEGLPWQLDLLGDIGHPRGQKVVVFTKVAGEKPPKSARSLSISDAAGLEPGADHYRAFVGPPGRFDVMSASQFALLFQLGLRDNDKVLDFGCGSLRLGRLLIPFLNPGGYFGIDPNSWLIDDGIDGELGRDAVRLKVPQFSFNDDFDCTVFDRSFDFIVAQSIVTHMGPDLLSRMLPTVAPALNERGLFLFSYIEAVDESGLPTRGWHYPECVAYGTDYINARLHEHNLVGAPLPWHHPGATWYMAARSKAALPSAATLDNLSGRFWQRD